MRSIGRSSSPTGRSGFRSRRMGSPRRPQTGSARGRPSNLRTCRVRKIGRQGSTLWRCPEVSCDEKLAMNETRCGKGAVPVCMLATALVAAALLAYAGSFTVPFLLDDYRWIVEDPGLHDWASLGEHRAIGDRPLVVLSLGVNYALGGLDVRGYHAFNFAVHATGRLAAVRNHPASDASGEPAFIPPVARHGTGLCDRLGLAAPPVADAKCHLRDSAVRVHDGDVLLPVSVQRRARVGGASGLALAPAGGRCLRSGHGLQRSDGDGSGRSVVVGSGLPGRELGGAVPAARSAARVAICRRVGVAGREPVQADGGRGRVGGVRLRRGDARGVLADSTGGDPALSAAGVLAPPACAWTTIGRRRTRRGKSILRRPRSSRCWLPVWWPFGFGPASAFWGCSSLSCWRRVPASCRLRTWPSSTACTYRWRRSLRW